MRFLIYLLIIFISTNVLADQSIAIYHCPDTADIQYQDGDFFADTNYYGIPVHWFTEKYFENPEKLKGFIFAGLVSTSYGYFEIHCVYKTESDMIFIMEVSRQEYFALVPIAGPWTPDNMCYTSTPSNCLFEIVQDPNHRN